jgi:thioesterase domain-containing protein
VVLSASSLILDQGFSAEVLTATIHREIPITQHLGVDILSLDHSTIKVEAPLQNNINIHGTAFAGSIYSIMSITGWAMTAQLSQVYLGQLHTVVLKEANIKYLRPLTDNIIARAEIKTDAIKTFKEQFFLKNKTRANLEVECYQNKKLAAVFNGEYVVLQSTKV